NPHYGGTERRIEPYLLDFEGDLYGRRLLVEHWERLRDERAFDSEEALVEQIARDVEATRAAVRPAGAGSTAAAKPRLPLGPGRVPAGCCYPCASRDLGRSRPSL